jgi:malate dehydrogenase
MKKIAIIGAGNVGGQAAFFCAQQELGEIVLIDIKEGLAKGKALDQNQALALMGINPLVTGSESLEDVRGSDVVLVTSGIARKPGMTREQLLQTNLSIIREVSNKIRDLAPKSIVIMMTNPVDVLSHACMKYTGFPRERVIGQAGVLDSGRFCCNLSRELNISARDIQAMVLGGHGDTMVPLADCTTVAGAPVNEFLEADVLEGLMSRTRDGGAEIVALLKDSSAYFAPALASVLMIESILRGKKRLLPCSVYADGEYGLRGTFIGLPVVLSERGMEEVVTLSLPPDRQEALKKSFDFYLKQVESLGIER